MTSIEHNHYLNLCDEHEQAWYSEKYDAYYCPDDDCRKWLEEKCDDRECEFCSIRPDESPGMAILKFNTSNGAILCSKCNIIVKEGFDNFSILEIEAFKGIIGGLEEYFCESCKE